jgi:plastocyanin
VASGQTAQVNWTLVTSGNGGSSGRVQALASSFDPPEVTIPVGGTVTFVGATAGHTVTPDNPNQTGVWTGFNLGLNQEVTITFDTAGTFEYHCIPHASIGMRGKIIVENN